MVHVGVHAASPMRVRLCVQYLHVASGCCPDSPGPGVTLGRVAETLEERPTNVSS